jgi:hypothetical protein
MKTIAQQLNIKEFHLRLKIRMEMKSTLNIHMDIGIKKNLILMEMENSNGFWHKQEFDSNGENSAGIYEYDLNGKEIYYENSDGVWCKYEYDSKGNQIYYENSFGRIEDNRPNCEGKIVEIEGKKYKLTSL